MRLFIIRRDFSRRWESGETLKRRALHLVVPKPWEAAWCNRDQAAIRWVVEPSRSVSYFNVDRHMQDTLRCIQGPSFKSVGPIYINIELCYTRRLQGLHPISGLCEPILVRSSNLSSQDLLWNARYWDNDCAAPIHRSRSLMTNSSKEEKRPYPGERDLDIRYFYEVQFGSTQNGVHLTHRQWVPHYGKVLIADTDKLWWNRSCMWQLRCCMKSGKVYSTVVDWTGLHLYPIVRGWDAGWAQATCKDVTNAPGILCGRSIISGLKESAQVRWVK